MELDPVRTPRAVRRRRGGVPLHARRPARAHRSRRRTLPSSRSEIKVPPKVKAAEGAHVLASAKQIPALSGGGQRREYWIRAEKVKWNIVPTGRDAMMDEKIKGKTKFVAYAYRAYSPNFAAPLGPGDDPRAADRGRDRRRGRRQLPERDRRAGDDAPARHLLLARTWTAPTRAATPTPAASCSRSRPFSTSGRRAREPRAPGSTTTTARWTRCRCSRGCSGRSSSIPAGAPRPTREFNLAFHSFQPVATGLNDPFSCINGHAYAGNTPTLHASVGDSVTFNVFALDNDFHTFHIHGHRWTNEAGRIIDNETLGPADSMTRVIHRGQPRPLVLPLPRVHPPAQWDERLVPRLLARPALAALADRARGLGSRPDRRRRQPADLDLQLPVV